MLNVLFRKLCKNVSESCVRYYGKDPWDFLSNTVSVNTKVAELPPERKITKDLILRLEEISLVSFGDERGIKIVEDAISYADKLQEVDTESVEPLYTVLENECLYLREDFVKRDVSPKDLLSHSEKTCEDYFVAPVGNVRYLPEESKFASDNSDRKIDQNIKEEAES